MSDSNSKLPLKLERFLFWGAWICALAAVAVAVYLGWRVSSARAEPGDITVKSESVSVAASEVELPPLENGQISSAIGRHPNLYTVIPNRPRQDAQDYTVTTGDSVFAIAQAFGIDPETVLWANYEVLNDNPDQLSPGMELKIPPTDGVLYTWQEGDTLKGVAERFEANVEDILTWSGNKLDLTNPTIESGQLLMVPGGHREYRQWIVPTIPRGIAGVSSNLYGAGTCTGGYEGAYGTGGFVWPADNHYLSGNDYWSGHLAIDIAAGEGAGVYAADSGVVVFAGPALGGYGNMIMLDHGNGYQTLYAHLSSIGIGCGASVYQGGYIGSSGSTGRSTGPHLHF